MDHNLVIRPRLQQQGLEAAGSIQQELAKAIADEFAASKKNTTSIGIVQMESGGQLMSIQFPDAA